jgi:uncharacterized membrane protein
MRFLLLSLILTVVYLLPAVGAATLYGTVFNEDLSVAKNVLITIDTHPQQRLLSVNGTYSFEVPRGNYIITAISMRSGRNQSVSEQVSVVQDGTFALDLLFFPNMDDASDLYNDIATDLEQPPPNLVTERASPWPLIAFIAFIVALLVAPVLYLRRRFRVLETESNNAESDNAEADDAEMSGVNQGLQAIIAALREQGGRITQKELRKRFPHSEAKVSLMVAQLVAEGKVKKIKQGRGNILVLK